MSRAEGFKGLFALSSPGKLDYMIMCPGCFKLLPRGVAVDASVEVSASTVAGRDGFEEEGCSQGPLVLAEP